MLFFSRDLGIDLGTSNVLIYAAGRGIVLREPSVVAVDANSNEVLAIGTKAKEMLGRTPESITAVRPLKDGVIADFEVTAAMLKYFVRKAIKAGSFTRPHIVICIPSGVTEVERRAVEDAAKQAGASRVELILEPVAAAIGAGLPTGEPVASMVLDSGVVTSDIQFANSGKVKMLYLTRDTEVQPGSIITTSGAGGVFPGDLLIGRVDSVERSNADSSYYAILTPYVDVTEVTDVFVVTDFDGKGDVTTGLPETNNKDEEDPAQTASKGNE